MAPILLVICSGHWVSGVGQDPPSSHITILIPPPPCSKGSQRGLGTENCRKERVFQVQQGIRKKKATAASNWEERKGKDNRALRLISLRRAWCWLQMKASLKKNPRKCQIFQT